MDESTNATNIAQGTIFSDVVKNFAIVEKGTTRDSDLYSYF